jgi:uncharacterized protein (TIGR03435 family)
MRKRNRAHGVRRMSPRFVILLGRCCVFAALIPGIPASRLACAQDAQTQGETLRQAQAVPKLSYEVATIKPDKSGNGSWKNTADGFSTGGMPVSNLIRTAYGLFTPEQIVGLPAWASSEPLDVQAKMDADTVAALEKLPPMQQWKQRQLMLQSLLAERFALKIHHVSKPMSVYALTIAKGGSKLEKSPLDQGGNTMYFSGKIVAQTLSMESFAMNLSNRVGKITVDRTGLTGNYNFTLEWARRKTQIHPTRGPRSSRHWTNNSD